MSTTELREYELIAVLNGKSAENIAKGKTDIQSNFSKRKVDIIDEKDWGTKKLFHLADKETEGSFQYYKFKADPQTIAQINSDLRVNQSVLKSMLKKLG
ncbi:MAG: 30S ribosomal protein S6 [Spirochaetia bacterium]|nr:30S ribosomal protein S6 [Spirochaetia bacterium]